MSKNNKQLPNGHTEQSLASLIQRVAKPLTYKLQFGVWSPEDLMQVALIEGFKVVTHYDGQRPLESLLYVHIKRRLMNVRRNKYFRLEEPCKQCPLKAFIKPDQCALYKDRSNCNLFGAWEERNRVKRALCDSFEIDEGDATEYLPAATFEYSELLNLKLDPHDRKLYLMLIHNCKLSKKNRQYICQIIKNVVHSTP